MAKVKGISETNLTDLLISSLNLQRILLLFPVDRVNCHEWKKNLSKDET